MGVFIIISNYYVGYLLIYFSLSFVMHLPLGFFCFCSSNGLIYHVRPFFSVVYFLTCFSLDGGGEDAVPSAAKEKSDEVFGGDGGDDDHVVLPGTSVNV